MKRQVIIGAIGGDKQRQAAIDFGQAVAKADCILLTGGGDIDSDGVKDASKLGAEDAGRNGAIARFVGILPSNKCEWITTPSSLLFYTGFPHNIRNVLNGVTPDVLVVFGGSRGTLAETAFAAAMEKKLFFFSGAEGGGVNRLQRNFQFYFNQDGNESDIECYLRQPLAKFSYLFDNTWTPDSLKSLLNNVLQKAEDWKGNVDELVQICMATVASNDLQKPSGFPDLPNDFQAKERFESEILRISTLTATRG